MMGNNILRKQWETTVSSASQNYVHNKIQKLSLESSLKQPASSAISKGFQAQIGQVIISSQLYSLMLENLKQ